MTRTILSVVAAAFATVLIATGATPANAGICCNYGYPNGISLDGAAVKTKAAKPAGIVLALGGYSSTNGTSLTGSVLKAAPKKVAGIVLASGGYYAQNGTSLTGSTLADRTARQIDTISLPRR